MYQFKKKWSSLIGVLEPRLVKDASQLLVRGLAVGKMLLGALSSFAKVMGYISTNAV